MKKHISIILACLMLLCVFASCSKEEPAPTTTTTTTTETTTVAPNEANPFTGDADFKKSAVGVRPVAIVVENHPQARPQWAIGSSDIIVEGEVEGGISRMLWLYADYTSLPEQIGPTRSARPSFVEFANFFDAIFIHWGGSHSKYGYVGGYSMFKNLNMAHIDGMKGGKVFGRASGRSVAIEHTGIVKGKNVADEIKNKKYRTEIKEEKAYPFSFNDEVTDAGETEAKSVSVAFSSRTDTRKLAFHDEDKLYHCSDWKEDVKFQNIIILCAESEYMNVPYKNTRTTYLNYKWTSGKGYYISNGKACEIKWDATSGAVKLTDAQDNELKLNKGKSYIAFSSTNNGGKVTLA